MTLPQLPDAIEPALDVIDGVLLAPGRDIEPRRYGQEPHPLLAATEPQRDEFELPLVAGALDRGLPVLGMCRGIQVLNVALGGTLAQDVSLLVDGSPHRSRLAELEGGRDARRFSERAGADSSRATRSRSRPAASWRRRSARPRST